MIRIWKLIGKLRKENREARKALLWYQDLSITQGRTIAALETRLLIASYTPHEPTPSAPQMQMAV